MREGLLFFKKDTLMYGKIWWVVSSTPGLSSGWLVPKAGCEDIDLSGSSVFLIEVAM